MAGIPLLVTPRDAAANLHFLLYFLGLLDKKFYSLKKVGRWEWVLPPEDIIRIPANLHFGSYWSFGAPFAERLAGKDGGTILIIMRLTRVDAIQWKQG